MAKYTDDTKQEAYVAYRASGTIEGVYRLLKCQVSHTTLHKWKARYDWDERVKEDRKGEVANLNDSMKFVGEVIERFDLNKNAEGILRETHVVGAICHAAIMGEEIPDALMRPSSFKEAVSGLKICWDTRLRLFGIKDSVNTDGRERADFGQIHQYYGTVNQNISDKTLNVLTSGEDE